MAGVRFPDVQARPPAFLDVPSLTRDAFEPVVPPGAAGRLAGKPRTARQCAVYTNGPLPTPVDRLFLLLPSLTPSARQVVEGHLFGRGHSQAYQWIPTLGDPRARSRAARATAGGLGGGGGDRGRAADGGAPAWSPHILGTSRRAGVPPCAHDGTARRLVRPQDAAAQTACDRGKTKDHAVKN